MFLFYYPVLKNRDRLITATENYSYLSAPLPAILVTSVEEKARSIFFKWTDSKTPTKGAPREYVIRYKQITYMYKFTRGFLMISQVKENIDLTWITLFEVKAPPYFNVSQVNPFFHNTERSPKYTFKFLRCEHCKVFKVCLVIFQLLKESVKKNSNKISSWYH